MGAAEAVECDVTGEGSFRGARWWRRKLRSSPSTVEGAAHGSSGEKRKMQTKARVLDPSIDDLGSRGPCRLWRRQRQ
ncbi:hypothetical protein BHE74_00005738 [Ensete ventricosum]|uniref:Uncharacterized protein n=1 Tax=Ensete ventricosum TaxID=4639 RepID=A0A427AI43_ENSVE|nr:hypothetical protein B296_00007576 [Ensete ventricosum]RWW85573.1 hypothetical protein BHE74_00005738 [Ensete ventricosum]